MEREKKNTQTRLDYKNANNTHNVALSEITHQVDNLYVSLIFIILSRFVSGYFVDIPDS